MDYKKVYDSITNRAKERELTGYKESHHIIPKCLGGSNKKDNLVNLTAREHFICHWLLSRLHSTDKKLAYAFFAMTKQKSGVQERYTPSSRTYEEARSNYSKLGFSQDHIDKIVATRKGKKTIVHRVTKKIKYILPDELESYLETGEWENTNYSKGRTGISEEGKLRLAECRRKEQTGRVGVNAKASKGIVVLEYEDGTKVEAGSVVQLSKLVDIKQSTLGHRILNNPNKFIKGSKIYYK